jgi:hypothetical protein
MHFFQNALLIRIRLLTRSVTAKRICTHALSHTRSPTVLAHSSALCRAELGASLVSIHPDPFLQTDTLPAANLLPPIASTFCFIASREMGVFEVPLGVTSRVQLAVALYAAVANVAASACVALQNPSFDLDVLNGTHAPQYEYRCVSLECTVSPLPRCHPPTPTSRERHSHSQARVFIIIACLLPMLARAPHKHFRFVSMVSCDVSVN